MSFQSTDLGFFFSGSGGPGESRELNLGGAISATEIVHSQNQNWAPDIPRSIVGAIGTSGTWSVYFPFYVKNKHDTVTITDVKLTVLNDVNNVNVDMQIGFDPAGLNSSIQTITGIDDAPTGVTFQNPVTILYGGWWTETTVWNLASSMAPGDYIGLWMRLYGPKGKASIPSIKFQLKCAFVRPA